MSDIPLIIFGTHHKCGTYLMKDVTTIFSEVLGKKYRRGQQHRLQDDTEVWFINNAKINFDLIKRDYLGIHIYRHPLQVILSGYKYHKICDEYWCNSTNTYNIKGKNYKQHLNSLNKNNGIKFEMNNCAKAAITEMYNWDYNNPKILNVKFEDIMNDFNREFSKIFDFLKIDKKTKEKLMLKIEKINIYNKKKTNIDKNPHITNKTFMWNSYKYELTPEHIKHFNKIYPADLMDKLKYTIEPLVKPIRLKTNYKWKYVKLINKLFKNKKISMCEKNYYIKNYKSFTS